MEPSNEIKYNQFKNILSGCRTIPDAYHFAEVYSSIYPNMKDIYYSMANGKHYSKIFDFKSMIDLLNDINKCNTYEEALDKYNNAIKKTDDYIQNKTLLRLLNSKQHSSISSNAFVKNIKNTKYPTNQNCSNHCYTIKKNCPHCNCECEADKNATYVICGYTDIRVGYDWEGCGHDWCFSCEKKLCKKWDGNKLFVEQNKKHDAFCCKHHAEKHNVEYEKCYCMCDNEFVDRKIHILKYDYSQLLHTITQ